MSHPYFKLLFCFIKQKHPPSGRQVGIFVSQSLPEDYEHYKYSKLLKTMQVLTVEKKKTPN